MAKVEFKNVKKYYGKVKTIENLNLFIENKEFLVLVGPSGCGKSTILRLIAGLEEITDGDITIGDKIVNDIHPKDRDIAMVFQNYALYPHMSVYDNMAFGLKMRKTPKAKIEQKVNQAAKILDLDQLLKRKPKELSGGQRQRVALGRAIVRNPSVFLMDEPLSNLDAKLRVHMRSEIKKLHNQLQTTVVYVTHDQVEAMTMGSRIVVLHEGIIQQIDKPEIVYKYPENMFVASFIGSPAINFINGTVKDNYFVIKDLKFELNNEQAETIKQHNLNEKEVVLGIRPEFFTLEQSPCSIDVTPNFIEILGSELLVHFEVDHKHLTAKLPYGANIVQDSKCTIGFNINNCLFFDPKTQKRLTR